MKTSQYIALFLVIFFASCQSKQAENNSSAQENDIPSQQVSLSDAQLKNLHIKYGDIEQKTIKGILQLKGTLDVPPQSIVSITPPYGGYLKSTNMMIGKRVSRGQVLAILEHPDYVQLQQDYLDVTAKIEYAEAELGRQKLLNKEQISAQKTLQQANVEYRLLANQREALAQKLALINISSEKLIQTQKISRSVALLSPISGYIQSVNANIGKYVQPADVLFEIVNTQHMHIALSVFEKDVNKLKINQKVKFYLPNNDNRIRYGTIHLIGQSIANDKTLPIHVHIDQDDARLLPGMFVSAEVEVTSQHTQTLPTSALVKDGENFFVFVEVKPKVFQLIPVFSGISDQNNVEITQIVHTYPKGKIVLEGAKSLFFKMKSLSEE